LKQKTIIFYLIHLYGATSLIYASENDHLDIVQYLISKGANIEATNDDIFIIFLNGKTSINLANNDKIKEILKNAKKNK
jgi:ankyrin repeat protein